MQDGRGQAMNQPTPSSGDKVVAPSYPLRAIIELHRLNVDHIVGVEGALLGQRLGRSLCSRGDQEFCEPCAGQSMAGAWFGMSEMIE
jgi:hypothetical protein